MNDHHTATFFNLEVRTAEQKFNQINWLSFWIEALKNVFLAEGVGFEPTVRLPPR